MIPELVVKLLLKHSVCSWQEEETGRSKIGYLNFPSPYVSQFPTSWLWAIKRQKQMLHENFELTRLYILTFVFLVFSCLFSLKSEGAFGMLSSSLLFIHLMFWRRMLVNMTSYGWRVLACLTSLIGKNSTGFWTSHFCLLFCFVFFYSVVLHCVVFVVWRCWT